MVPVSWALASADVKAGTARAARIAIIAITTSNSISVNAVNLLSFIFIRVFSLRCSEGFDSQSVWVGCSAFAQGFGGQVSLGIAAPSPRKLSGLGALN